MTPDTQKSEIENLRIKSTAKTKVHEVQNRIQASRGNHAEKPTLTETLLIMADHYLETTEAA